MGCSCPVCGCLSIRNKNLGRDCRTRVFALVLFGQTSRVTNHQIRRLKSEGLLISDEPNRSRLSNSTVCLRGGARTEVRVRNEGDRGKAMRCDENWDENRWILFCFEIIGSSSENFYCAFGRAYYYARRPVSLRSSQTDIQEQKPPVKTDPEKRKRWRPSVRPCLHPHSLRQLLSSLFVCVFLSVCLCGSGLAGAARETQFPSHPPSLSHPHPHSKEASDEIYCRTHQTWRNNTDPAEETRIDAAADRPPYQTRQSKKSPNRAYLRDVTLHHKR